MVMPQTPATASLLRQIEALLPSMQQRAMALDAEAAFPVDDMRDLMAAGVLRSPLPATAGGLGLGTEPAAATGALELFRLLGRGNLSLGRLVEAHVNALRLVVRWGDVAVQRRVARDMLDGHLVGLWVTDPAEGGLTVRVDGTLEGAKQFCSGAGHASRAVVTAVDESCSTRLVYVANEAGFRASPLASGLAGMRAAKTGQVRYDGTPGMVFGAAGDYLREPDFSCGAWRTSAVTLGGIEALAEQLRRQLVARGRAADPHQQARVGQALIATETARLWMAEAALRAEADDDDPDAAIAYVGLSRLAVERAALDVIELTQRSLGVGALMRANPVELLCRDLATYLRQPAADMVLTEAASQALKA